MDDDLLECCDLDEPVLGKLRWWHILLFFWVLS
jgi:hypothetical protein